MDLLFGEKFACSIRRVKNGCSWIAFIIAPAARLAIIGIIFKNLRKNCWPSCVHLWDGGWRHIFEERRKNGVMGMKTKNNFLFDKYAYDYYRMTGDYIELDLKAFYRDVWDITFGLSFYIGNTSRKQQSVRNLNYIECHVNMDWKYLRMLR